MSPVPSALLPAEPETRAEFRALLVKTTKDALRQSRYKRHVEGFPLLLRQLEAVLAWSGKGLGPGEAERSLIVLDRIAGDEFSGPQAGLPKDFLAALESLQRYFDSWPPESATVSQRARPTGESPILAIVSDLTAWIADADLPTIPVQRSPWRNRVRAWYYRVVGAPAKTAFAIVPFFRTQLSMLPTRESEYEVRLRIDSMQMLLDTCGRELRDPQLLERLADVVRRTEEALEEGWWLFRDELPDWSQEGNAEEPVALSDFDGFVRLLRGMDMAGQSCRGDLELEILLNQRVLALYDAATDWVLGSDPAPAPEGPVIDGATLGDPVLARRWDDVEEFARDWSGRLGGPGAGPAERSVRGLHEARRELHALDDAGRSTARQKTLLKGLGDSIAKLRSWCDDPGKRPFPRWETANAERVKLVLLELGLPWSEPTPLTAILRGEFISDDAAEPNPDPTRASPPEPVRTTEEYRELLIRTRVQARACCSKKPDDEQAHRLVRMLSGLEILTRPGRTPSVHVRGAVALGRFAERELATLPVDYTGFLAEVLPMLEAGLIGWPAGGDDGEEAPELGSGASDVGLRLELSLAARLLGLEAINPRDDPAGAYTLSELIRDLLSSLADPEQDMSTLEAWASEAEAFVEELHRKPGQLGSIARGLADLARRTRDTHIGP